MPTERLCDNITCSHTYSYKIFSLTIFRELLEKSAFGAKCVYQVRSGEFFMRLLSFTVDTVERKQY